VDDDVAPRLIQQAIAAGPIPGAAVAIGGPDDERLACFGSLEIDGPPVTPDSWYDLASLTKVLCTVPLLLEAIVAGKLDPRAPLREVVPEIAWLQDAPNLGDATVLQCVTHTSGLPAWSPLYTLGLDRSTLLARVLHVSLEREPGEIVYSDIGFILLGHVLERLHGQRLDVLAHDLYRRLHLDHALAFAPGLPADGSLAVAPTERCPWRNRVLRGEVHDENAAALDGIAGHAGLFGTLQGLCGYIRAVVDCRLQSAAALAYLTHEHARAAPPSRERRGFGWVLMHAGWSGGDLMSARSIGHTGFTGTGLWIDLERGRWSVLLTNRVYPSRHTDSHIVQLRRAFNHAAHGSLPRGQR
jgi:CubicO group peptidase (beta-lactamase class C family)